MHHRRALVLSALAASLCLPSTLRDSTRSTRRSCATASRSTASCSTSGLPGDRQRQRRHPCVGHAGLRGVAAVRQGPPAEGRLSRQGAGVHVPVLPRARARRAGADGADGRRPTRPARSTTQAAVTSPRRSRASTSSSRPPGAERHDRLGLRGERLRRLHRGQHRADPARLLQLRGQGRQRQGRRRGRRDHLQRGPAGPPGAASSARSAARRTSRSSASAIADAKALRRSDRRRSRDAAHHDLDRGRSGGQDQEPDRRLQAGQRGRDRRRRRAPRLRRRRSGHQRQRLRLGHDPRDRRGDERAEDQAAPRAALQLLGRRGVRPARLRALRRGAVRRTSWARSTRTSTSTWSARPTTSASSTTATAPTTETAGPPGSAQIEGVFNKYFAGQGLRE